jgi:hypothetical protein
MTERPDESLAGGLKRQGTGGSSRSDAFSPHRRTDGWGDRSSSGHRSLCFSEAQTNESSFRA